MSMPYGNGTYGLTNGSMSANLVYSAIHGHPTMSGQMASGHLLYLGGYSAWSGSTTSKDAGLHVMYNSLLAAGGPGPGPAPAWSAWGRVGASRAAPGSRARWHARWSRVVRAAPA